MFPLTIFTVAILTPDFFDVSGTFGKISQIGDLLKETHCKCFYCGEDLNDKYEIEHFIPRALGGTGTRKNLTVSCKKCNHIKLDYSLIITSLDPIAFRGEHITELPEAWPADPRPSEPGIITMPLTLHSVDDLLALETSVPHFCHLTAPQGRAHARRRCRRSRK